MHHSILLFLGLLTFTGFTSAAELDTDAVGEDLNGWRDGNVARFGKQGAKFEVERPRSIETEDGGLRIEATVREMHRFSARYEAVVVLSVSPDGIVRSASIEGTVDGRDFDTGEASRPRPGVISQGNGEAGTVEPSDPDREMRRTLAESLGAALDRARESDTVVKRDLSSRIFGSGTTEAASLVEGTMTVVRTLARHLDHS